MQAKRFDPSLYDLNTSTLKNTFSIIFLMNNRPSWLEWDWWRDIWWCNFRGLSWNSSLWGMPHTRSRSNEMSLQEVKLQ